MDVNVDFVKRLQDRGQDKKVEACARSTNGSISVNTAVRSSWLCLPKSRPFLSSLDVQTSLKALKILYTVMNITSVDDKLFLISPAVEHLLITEHLSTGLRDTSCWFFLRVFYNSQRTLRSNVRKGKSPTFASYDNTSELCTGKASEKLFWTSDHTDRSGLQSKGQDWGCWSSHSSTSCVHIILKLWSPPIDVHAGPFH